MSKFLPLLSACTSSSRYLCAIFYVRRLSQFKLKCELRKLFRPFMNIVLRSSIPLLPTSDALFRLSFNRRFTRLILLQFIISRTIDGSTASFTATGRTSIRIRPAPKIRCRTGAIVAASHASSGIITHGHELGARKATAAARRTASFVTFIIRGTSTDAAARHSVLGHRRRSASRLI